MNMCVVCAGKLYDSMGQGIEAEFVNFPNNEKVIDLACAAQFMVALTESGNVYYWGKMQVSCLNHWVTVDVNSSVLLLKYVLYCACLITATVYK